MILQVFVDMAINHDEVKFARDINQQHKKNNMHITRVHRVCWIHLEKIYSPNFFFQNGACQGFVEEL